MPAGLTALWFRLFPLFRKYFNSLYELALPYRWPSKNWHSAGTGLPLFASFHIFSSDSVYYIYRPLPWIPLCSRIASIYMQPLYVPAAPHRKLPWPIPLMLLSMLCMCSGKKHGPKAERSQQNYLISDRSLGIHSLEHFSLAVAVFGSPMEQK